MTQQEESYTNTVITIKTNEDTSPMRTIAALTIIFLSGTLISSVFGMTFFDSADGSVFVLKEWWLYLAITVPLTLITVELWWSWETISNWAGEFEQKRMAKAHQSRDE